MVRLTHKYSGFILVELTIGIVIVNVIGIANVVIPSYHRFQLKVKTSEATNNLGAIRAAQETYRAENGTYLACTPSPSNGGTDATPDPWVDAGGEFTEIGFVPDGDVRYQYQVIAGPRGITTSYIITATGDLDDDDIDSVYTVTESQPKAVHSGDDL